MQRYDKSLATIENSDSDAPHGGFTAILSTPSLDRDGDRLNRDEWVEPLPERLPLDIDHGMSVADTVGSFHPYFDGDTLMMDATFASTPRAQEVRALVQEGHISNVSVAFMTDKSKKDGQASRELLNAGIVNTPANREAVILASKAYSALRDAIPAVSEDEAREIFAPEGKDTEEDETVVKILSALKSDKDAGTVYVNILPKFDTKAFTEQLALEVKAALSPGGGGDAALTQAIHDASVHLGAICIQMVSDEDPTGASDGANKGIEGAAGTIIDGLIKSVPGEAIAFTNTVGESMNFVSHDDARAFFTDMLKSIDDADAAGETLVEVGQEADEKSADDPITLDQFKALATDSPEESPEAPAPADEAAAAVSADKSADEMATRARIIRMRASARLGTHK